ncbi:glycosyltransferase [Methylobacterium sp. V23]|uniref:glycosyltransferase family 2 protein n=1 Tax=Methylobacterium sp. V23 TaxID=2044878 RepID=UPI001FDF5D3F|nr:glycosyltransferase [Methylobacterium sp. V23]
MSRRADAALAFAGVARNPVWLRWGRAAALLLRHRGEGLAILRARLAGKRVRAGQAAAALFGLDHAGLLCGPAAQGRLLRATAAGGAAGPRDTVAVLTLADLTSADLTSADLTSADLTSADSAQGRPSEASRAGAEILVLTAPGHALLPGAPAILAEAFARSPVHQLAYGDALLRSETGLAMPLLRPAFDPDYACAVAYCGPVLALRASALAALTEREGPVTDALDLILRVVERFGNGAIGHLPRLLSRSDVASTGMPDPAARAATLRRALDRRGDHAVAIQVEKDGVLTFAHPLPQARPRVSLIVPTRDRVDLLRTCITSLIGCTDWPEREILICDNDSRAPETLAYFRELEAAGIARIVPCPGPFDFAGMNNRAAAAAQGQVLAFINNDVAALHPDWLERLVREALRPDVGAVGAKLIDGRGRIQHGGVLLGPGGLVTHAHRFFSGEAPGYLAGLWATRAVAAVTAACLVVEAHKFAAVGGFDAAAFAVDFNDVDLCLRLNAAGYRTLFVPGAVLRHDEAASRRWTPAAQERHRREVAAFQDRWGPLLAQDPHYHPGFDPDLGTYARLRPGWPEAGPVDLR